MNRDILRLTIPNIISNISVPLIGMVDLAILGHLENEIYIGAIALGGMIFNFIYLGLSFLRMGTTGFTAQAFGKKDPVEQKKLLGQALLTGFSLSFLLLALQIPIELLGFRLFEGSARVETLAREYFYIRIWAAPATLSLYVFSGWFLGMQNAKFPMIITLVVNIVNLLANLFFVFGLGMKSEGVALGTVIAQYTGLALSLIFYFIYYHRKLPSVSFNILTRIDQYKKFFVVNRDIFIRSMLLVFTLSFFTSKSAGIGDTILAVNTLLFQFFLLYSYFIDGFAYAAEALSGKLYGANDKARLILLVRRLFIMGFIISIPFTIIYGFAGNDLLKILTNNQNVITETSPYLPWIGIIPLITFPAFLWDGIYIGTTSSVSMRNAMIISSLLIFLPAYYLLRDSMGNHGLWLALMLFMFSRGVFLWAGFKKVLKRIA